MSLSTIIKYSQRFKITLIIEYFYKGEKIDNPIAFFEKNPVIFEKEFPARTEFVSKIAENLKFKDTHKLVVSEYGFHLIHR